MEDYNIVHHFTAKGKNKRIQVALHVNVDKTHFFRVSTKTLVDFKKRHILQTDNAYSVETFVLLKQIFDCFLDNPEISNKILNKEIAKIQKFNAYASFR